MTQALRWDTYLRSHVRRAYNSGSVAAADAARAVISKIKERKLVEGFSAREIIRAQWSRLRDAETVHGALQMLCDHEWIEEVRSGERGRRIYTINPKLHQSDERGVPN